MCESIIHLDVEDTSSDLKTKIKLVISKMDEIGQKSVAFPIDGKILKMTSRNLTIALQLLY